MVEQARIEQFISLVLMSLLARPGEPVLGYDLFSEDHWERTLENLQRFGVPAGVELVRADTAELTAESLQPKLGAGVRLLHICGRAR